jgi:hypothetical protein
VVYRTAREPDRAAHVNRSLAYLLRDSISLMDRSYVLSLVNEYCTVISQRVTQQADVVSGAMHDAHPCRRCNSLNTDCNLCIYYVRTNTLSCCVSRIHCHRM